MNRFQSLLVRGRIPLLLGFLALGGAYSIDEDYRTPGKSWWATELINSEDQERAIAGGPVDVMVTHDSPEGVDIPTLRRWAPIPKSQANRERLLEVVKAVRPLYLTHGHYHDRYSDKLRFVVDADADGNLVWHEVQIEGVGADMSPTREASYVFDTEAFRAARPGA